tara:strand:- start:79 stop:486 length:408 start_codon:yes stop_codon:yes gene_type:complete
MTNNFNNAFYLIIFIVHFAAYGFYFANCCLNTKNFMKKYGVDKTSATFTRFIGAALGGSLLMAIYILFRGTDAAWAFFNLVFVQNLMMTVFGFYTLKVDKLGKVRKSSDEAFIAPGILTVLSAILCFGLADKIYI